MKKTLLSLLAVGSLFASNYAHSSWSYSGIQVQVIGVI
jgi:hypothetical protein